MAYADFTPDFRVIEAQDATSFKINDESEWNGESGITTICIVRIFHYLADGTINQFDDYPLIVGADKTKFNEYLDIDGHIIELSDLTIGGAAPAERFVDGYYVIRIVYSDGTYAVGSEPYYDNVQAFLAKARCKARKMPALLTWPLTREMYELNRNIFLLRMFLDAAEDQADLGKEVQFRDTIELINLMFSAYSIDECF